MDVDVRFFAAAREAAGLDRESVAIGTHASIAALETRLVELHPRLAALLPSVRYAVGERFVDRDASLGAGDEVAVLPPVSGG